MGLNRHFIQHWLRIVHYFNLDSSLYLLYMEKRDFIYRIFVIILSLLQPIIILIVLGEIPSISSSWDTSLQPLFICVNAMTSYFFFSAHRWEIPSILLLLLTAFSVESFPIVHNTFAVGFFIMCMYPIYKLRRWRYYLIPYLGGFFVVIKYGLFWGEFWSVWVLCIYNIHIVIHMYKIGIRRRYHLDK